MASDALLKANIFLLMMNIALKIKSSVVLGMFSAREKPHLKRKRSLPVGNPSQKQVYFGFCDFEKKGKCVAFLGLKEISTWASSGQRCYFKKLLDSLPDCR